MKNLNNVVFIIFIFIYLSLTCNAFELNISNGNILPAPSKNHLVIYDISVPTSPQKISDFKIENINKVYTKDNLVFVIADSLYILDLSNSLNPELLTNLNFDDKISDIFVDKFTLFVACSTKGIFIYDIENPKNPELIGKWDAYIGKEIVDFEVKDKFAYIALNDFKRELAYFYLMDLSDLSKPKVIKTWHLTFMLYKFLKIHDDKLIFNGDDYDLLVYRLESNIPEFYSCVYTDAFAINFKGKNFSPKLEDLWFVNNYVIGILKGYGIGIYDNIFPNHTKYIPIEGKITSISAKDNFLYVITENEIKIINLNTIKFVKLINEYTEKNIKFLDMAIKDDYLFTVSKEKNSLSVFKIENGKLEKLVSHDLLFVKLPLNIEIENNYAYVVGSYGLEIIDITNPASPKTVGRFPHNTITDIKVSDNFAIVKDQDHKTFLLNLTNFIKPNLFDRFKLWYKKKRYPNNYILPEKSITLDIQKISIFEKRGDFLYILGDNLLKVDIHKPSSPKVEIFNPKAEKLDIKKYIYIDNRNEVIFYDLEKLKENILKIPSARTGEYLISYAFKDNYLYLPFFPFYIFIFDITDFENPTLIEKVSENVFFGYDIKIKENYLFVCDNDGINVYDISPLDTKIEINSIKIDTE